MRFAELAAATNYSFLEGASHPHEMVATALALKHNGIGIADRNTVAGVVRAHVALREAVEALGRPIDFKLIFGSRLVFSDSTPDIIVYPTTRAGWGRLTRLLTTGNLRANKGHCTLYFEDLVGVLADMAVIVMGNDAAVLDRLIMINPGRTWLGATLLRNGRDRRRLVGLQVLSAQTGVPLIAVNSPLYAMPGDHILQDVMTCIREKTTISAAGRSLDANAERHLKSVSEMARLFADVPEAIAATQDLLACIDFNLEQLRYEYPHEPVPSGWSPMGWLVHLTIGNARERYRHQPVPRKLLTLLRDEFKLIRQLNYAYYFLTVHDLVAFARAQDPPILCQGRGSAANSVVCFLLGITSVDPVTNNLLFSRFVSADRNEPPDIDVDFEHERREEVIQYVYRRYGRHRAGIAATIAHYRPRSAVREIGKVLGLSEDITNRLSSTIWGSHASTMDEKRIEETGFDLENPDIARLNMLVGKLLGFPRHLGQHVGGFVLTQNRLDETVPIHNAAMPDRTFIEWD